MVPSQQILHDPILLFGDQETNYRFLATPERPCLFSGASTKGLPKGFRQEFCGKLPTFVWNLVAQTDHF